MDWKRKLTSRKLWMAVAGFASMLIIAFGAAQEVAAQVSAIIMAGASVIAYIIGEGLVDAQGATNEVAEKTTDPKATEASQGRIGFGVESKSTD